MNNALDGLRELVIMAIVGAVTGLWWVVRKLFTHDASFDLLKQDIENHRGVTEEIRSDVKRILEKDWNR